MYHAIVKRIALQNFLRVNRVLVQRELEFRVVGLVDEVTARMLLGLAH